MAPLRATWVLLGTSLSSLGQEHQLYPEKGMVTRGSEPSEMRVCVPTTSKSPGPVKEVAKDEANLD